MNFTIYMLFNDAAKQHCLPIVCDPSWILLVTSCAWNLHPISQIHFADRVAQCHLGGHPTVKRIEVASHVHQNPASRRMYMFHHNTLNMFLMNYQVAFRVKFKQGKYQINVLLHVTVPHIEGWHVRKKSVIWTLCLATHAQGIERDIQLHHSLLSWPRPATCKPWNLGFPRHWGIQTHISKALCSPSRNCKLHFPLHPTPWLICPPRHLYYTWA